MDGVKQPGMIRGRTYSESTRDGFAAPMVVAAPIMTVSPGEEPEKPCRIDVDSLELPKELEEPPQWLRGAPEASVQEFMRYRRLEYHYRGQVVALLKLKGKALVVGFGTLEEKREAFQKRCIDPLNPEEQELVTEMFVEPLPSHGSRNKPNNLAGESETSLLPDTVSRQSGTP